MKVVVGLGNPGTEYENTRHNVGFDVVERLAGEKNWGKSKSGLLDYCHIKVGDQPVELIRPKTFMNRSGDAVAYVVKKHGISIEDLWVVHDDLDLELGKYQMRLGKGPKVHNGVNSVEQALSDVGFWRVRVGVDSRSEEERARILGREYVLMKFGKEEREMVDGLVEEIAEDLGQRLSK